MLFILPCEILGNMCITIVCKPGCDVMNFEVNLIFLIKPFFPYDQKVMTKGYLCYKRITSQKVSSEAQIKNCFIL